MGNLNPGANLPGLEPAPKQMTLATNYLSFTDGTRDFAQQYLPELYEAEVKYLMHEEWAKSAEDILWRRTKLGLEFSDTETNKLEKWIKTTNN